MAHNMAQDKNVTEPWWDTALCAALIAMDIIWHIRPEMKPAFLQATWFITAAVIVVVGIFVWLTVSSRHRFKWRWWLFAIIITLWTIIGVSYLISCGEGIARR